MVQSLTLETARHVQSAEGWLELTSPAEALLELETISSAERSHPLVLEMFWRVYAEWQKWEPALEVADQLITGHPESAAGWIDRAYALRRVKGGGLKPAFDALLPALKSFPFEPVIPYNLACYCAQMNLLTEAREWLDQAMVVGDRNKLRKMALNDPDLEPLKAAGYLK